MGRGAEYSVGEGAEYSVGEGAECSVGEGAECSVGEGVECSVGKPRLGLVGGGLVFFDRCKRNLGGTCSRIPAEDSDGERAHHKENQAGRG